MRNADCRLQIAERTQGLRQDRHPFFTLHSALRTLHSRSAFTLIELMVAVGLTAILLTMVATIFWQASQSFRSARASIEINESARAALNKFEGDLTAAEFTSYGSGVQGYFALSQGPNDPATGSAPPVWNALATYALNDRVISSVTGGNEYISIASNNTGNLVTNTLWWHLLGPWVVPVATNGNPTAAVDTLTFTTLAPQPGARYAAPEAVEQLALVRYALEWDGGNATLPGGRPRPTFNLVKRVRFPATSDPNLNMDQFSWTLMNAAGQPVQPYEYLLPMEYTLHTSPPLPSTDPDVMLDASGLRYAQPEVIAFHVLSMNVRLFCLPAKTTAEGGQTGPPVQPGDEAFVEAGFASSAANPATLTDATKTDWSGFPAGSFAGENLRIYAGTAAGQWSTITNMNAATDTITLNASPPGTLTGGPPVNQQWPLPLPDPTSQYRVDGMLANLFPVPYPPPPAWYQRSTGTTSYDFFGPTYRPPAVVEVTLELTDVHATRSFIFTQRFYVPASER